MRTRALISMFLAVSNAVARDVLVRAPPADVVLIRERRVSDITAAFIAQAASIPDWLSTLGEDGQWPDDEIDYTPGCDARRANWPAQVHWLRILTMSAKDATGHREPIARAMRWWFENDYTVPACLEYGGSAQCPCGTAGLWNTNWYSNIILIPRLVAQVCLLLDGTLSQYETGYCDLIGKRAYNTFDRFVNGLGYLTGANTLDVAKNGIDQALRSPVNITLLSDAYRRVHLELTILDTVKADGIRRDGSFGQHGGIIYNGNYGENYVNAILELEIAAQGTSYSASTTSKAAFDTLFDGDQWMIYRNALTNVVHWDYSVLGRFISFPVIDDQATGRVKFNTSTIRELGQNWASNKLLEVADRLEKPSSNANVGDLRGNAMFYANDYMVHRGPGYVTTLKLTSSRTVNTECVNTQNPLGLHLADGVVHTYLQGNEYEDIAVAWDWNLIPGITIDYAATPLNCGKTGFTGIESFAGGVSTGAIGVAAMRFTNPATKSLKWQKAWFFLPNDVQHVMVSGIVSTTTAPIYSVLDQRLLDSGIFIDGEKNVRISPASLINTTSLWHGGVGYVFNQKTSNTTLKLKFGVSSGSWQTIGTSTQPPGSYPLFAAWLTHNNRATPLEYMVYPATANAKAFYAKSKSSELSTLQNDVRVSAVYDDSTQTAMVVFWDAASGGTVSFTSKRKTTKLSISSTKAVTLVYRMTVGTLTVSDPSQTLSTVDITLKLVAGTKPPTWAAGQTSKVLKVTFPKGGLAGSGASVSA